MASIYQNIQKAIPTRWKSKTQTNTQPLAVPGLKFNAQNKTVREIFHSKEFLCMKKNARECDWEVKEDSGIQVVDMINSLLQYPRPDPCHLGQFILAECDPESLTKQQLESVKDNSAAKWCNVHDGQQRIITIAGVHVALRNAIKEGLENGKIPNDDKAKANDIVNEIVELISPKDVHYKRISRIATRTEYLESQILPTDHTDNNDIPLTTAKRARPAKKKRRQSESSSKQAAKPPETDQTVHKSTRVLRTIENKLNAESPDGKLKNALLHMSKRFSELSFPDMCYLHTNLTDKTIVMVTSDMTDEQAVSYVLDMQKSSEISEVDLFKVRLLSNEKDKREDLIDSWIKLCRLTMRDTVKMACLYVAQIKQEQILSSGQYNRFEALEFFKVFVNDAIPKSKTKQVFDWIKSAAGVLFSLQTGFLETSQEGILEGLTEPRLNAQVNASFRLLRAIATNEGNGHGFKLAIISILLLEADDEQKVFFWRQLEPIAAWMLLTKPNKKEREERLASIISEVFDAAAADELPATLPSLELKSSEKDAMKNVLETGMFDSKEKATKALIEYINIAVPQGEGRAPTVVIAQDVFVERIIDDDEKKCNIGNLIASLTRPTKTPKGKDATEWKMEGYQNSPFPLSRDVATDLNSIAVDEEAAVSNNKDRIMKAAAKLFGV